MMLWGVAAAAGVLSLALLLWGALTPMGGDVASGDDSDGESGPRIVATPPDALPPVEAFASIWQRNVRGSLSGEVGPVEQVAYAPAPMEQSLNVQLLATAVEPGSGSFAVIIDEHGLMQVRRLGEYVAGAKIARIADGQIELERDGRRSMLAVPQSYGGPMGLEMGGGYME